MHWLLWKVGQAQSSKVFSKDLIVFSRNPPFIYMGIKMLLKTHYLQDCGVHVWGRNQYTHELLFPTWPIPISVSSSVISPKLKSVKHKSQSKNSTDTSVPYDCSGAPILINSWTQSIYERFIICLCRFVHTFEGLHFRCVQRRFVYV